jgi:predicted DNA-binding transcriptional regulator AlpA
MSENDLLSGLPDPVSPADLAAVFRVSTRAVLYWARDGRLPPPVRISRKVVRWPLAELRSWLAARRTVSEGGAA